MAPDAAALIVEMARGMNDGRVRSTQPRDERTILPTSFEAFSHELAEAYSEV